MWSFKLNNRLFAIDLHDNFLEGAIFLSDQDYLKALDILSPEEVMLLKTRDIHISSLEDIVLIFSAL